MFPHIGQVTNVNTVKLVSGSTGRQPRREAQLTGELCRSHTLSESHHPEERDREREGMGEKKEKSEGEREKEREGERE